MVQKTERLQNQYWADRNGEKKKKNQDWLIGTRAGYGERRKKTMKSVLRESGKKTRIAATMLTYTPATRPEKQRVYSKFQFPLLSGPPLSNVSFFFLLFFVFPLFWVFGVFLFVGPIVPIFILFFSQFSPKSGDRPQEDSAKSGYKTNLKIQNLGILLHVGKPL